MKRLKRWLKDPSTLIAGQFSSAIWTGIVGVGASIISGNPWFAIVALSFVAIDIAIKFNTMMFIINAIRVD